jgi:hypothetical protein
MRTAGVPDMNKGRFGRLDTPLGPQMWRRACLGVAFAIASTCVAQDSRPAAKPASTPPQASSAAPQAAGAETPTKQPDASSGSEQKKQISAESTQLVAMAMALKAEIDKTNKDVLSLNVIRKADEIEKLAHAVKEKIKQESKPN